MAAATDPALLVLLTLRLKSFVDAEVLANASGLPETEVASVLEQLQAGGLVSYRDGRVRGWSLTPAGRADGEQRLAAELTASGRRPVVEAAYDAFVPLNRRFLSACTRWQLRTVDGSAVLNEHDDRAHDAEVVAELDAVDEAVQPICRELAAALPRFAWYNGRFAVARLRVHAGDHEWFAGPMVDSYHAVWFELHENLLATLNRERSAEAR
jgi:hypothetical protein